MLCWFIGTWAGLSDGIIQIQNDAVKTECARYHPETRQFEWIMKESSGS